MKHTDEVLSGKQQRAIFLRLLRYAKGHKKMLSVAFIIMMIAATAELLQPILIAHFIDTYLTTGNFPTEPLAWLVSIFICLLLVAIISQYIQSLFFQKIALRIIQTLRVDVFKNVQKLGLSFFDKMPGGGLVSRITNDTESIKELYVTVLAVFVQNGIFMIGTFVAMFYLNATLALYCLIFLPFLFLVFRVYRKISSSFYETVSAKVSEINAKMSESVQGMRIIQAFRQEKRMKKEFAEMNEAHYQAGMKAMKADALLLRPIVDILSLMAISIVLLYFGFQSFVGPIEFGVLYAFVNLLDRFFEPVNQIMQRLSLFQQAIVSAGRVFRLMDREEYAPGATFNESENANEQGGSIEFKDVSFSYDGTTNVLHHISFQASRGETIALVGHTGSGKSSMINLLMRFYPLKHGEINIDGRPLYFFSEDTLRKRVGLVLQDSFLYSGTVASNITLGRKGYTRDDVRAACEFVGADRFIDALPNGYDTLIGERGTTFSSGERQLLSFARTMLGNPDILVLDEATASIDTETEETIQRALENMQQNRTTIAIAHRLSTIKHAQLILVLHQGEVVERGTHENLLKREGLYHKMYLLQAREQITA
ncbi:ABC transporter transmembrane domain-containing protein [Alkalihalobacillus sp. LMS6]|uniref:ABC transporter ATP-binding protein n=1 Tax=Alkalihalobacillus sp. LMS6 TaxID=2924034 RepID=UPI0020D02A23|nr:ABC transporter transmembrane domain-containing protein [Alkalihalobacillus sp. LMS6]UTR04670.1 ABC transporter transmembrane domain-containing protein [Alkalihalobacillus sp. LMS6]